jgi:hypothetical protein
MFRGVGSPTWALARCFRTRLTGWKAGNRRGQRSQICRPRTLGTGNPGPHQDAPWCSCGDGVWAICDPESIWFLRISTAAGQRTTDSGYSPQPLKVPLLCCVVRQRGTSGPCCPRACSRPSAGLPILRWGGPHHRLRHRGNGGVPRIVTNIGYPGHPPPVPQPAGYPTGTTRLSRSRTGTQWRSLSPSTSSIGASSGDRVPVPRAGPTAPGLLEAPRRICQVRS